MDHQRRISHACERCRRLRTKCSGGMKCSKCEADEAECVYGDRKRERNRKELLESKNVVLELQAKTERLSGLLANVLASTEIEPNLRAQVTDVLAAEASDNEDNPQDLYKSEATSTTSNQQGLWPGGPGVDGMHLDGSSQNSFAQPHGMPWRHPGHYDLSGPSRLSWESQQVLTDNEPTSSDNFRPSAWTDVTDDDGLVMNILALYFCWEYPIFASLSREHFLIDFHSGSTRFCSPLLVNSLLALGAPFCDLPDIRRDPDDPDTAGEPFYEEAQRLLGFEDVPSLTKIQALGLMSLRQASAGNDMSSWHYSRYAMRTAIDLGLHKKDSQDDRDDGLRYSHPERQVSAATFWGSYTLEVAWSLCVGREPQLLPEQVEVDKPIIVDEIEHELWRPYTDEGFGNDTSLHQHGNMRSVFKSFTQLSQLVHKTVICLNMDEDQNIGPRVRAIYMEFLQFYDAFPDLMRLGENSTPTVLFTHQYYHFALLLLFRPFFHMDMADAFVEPRLVCAEAAENILSLNKHFRSLFSLRRTPTFVSYIVMTAELSRMMDFDSTHRYQLYKTPTIGYLAEQAISHAFAKRAIAICNFFRKKWQIKVAQEDDQDSYEAIVAKIETEPTRLALPHAATFFRPDLDLERYHEGPPRLETQISLTTTKPRFVPFPLQGRFLGTMSIRS